MCCRTDQATAVRLLEKHHRGFRGTEPKASGTTAQLRQGPPHHPSTCTLGEREREGVRERERERERGREGERG